MARMRSFFCRQCGHEWERIDSALQEQAQLMATLRFLSVGRKPSGAEYDAAVQESLRQLTDAKGSHHALRRVARSMGPRRGTEAG